jgi:hypothetical protein
VFTDELDGFEVNAEEDGGFSARGLVVLVAGDLLSG